MSDYASQVLAGIKRISRDIDLSLFTGWVSGRFLTFSRCCSAEIYVRSLMEGIPYCSCCDKSLGPNGIRQEWVPPRNMDPDSGMACPWPMDPTPDAS